ncbi:circadian clock KaiB domain protein [Geotalea daltonii FRC-32]|uniref:Circadian clock KaiB domain protein n=1 Tax=Geotalea daltonii (strain DSM 22248 / JCM 15807 / FRC-32) TaxID=316067 RepID=B9M6C1_GEODF|nr:circadian clock KaiB family protein [Geotalea daltonii]ACM21909.1 circadian clock KaiB domain protein [Geotalea daltonii FRC-32]
MGKKKKDEGSAAGNALKDFELAVEKTKKGKYILRLYVTGTTPNSQRAIENVRKICEEHLNGRYELEIIDIYQQPIYAREGQIVAAPTLVKELPPPLRKFIGDMSQTDKILLGLDVRTKK